MQKLNWLRFPITAKAMLLIGALGMISATANWFSLHSLQQIDRISDTVTNQVAPARLILTEAKIAVESLGLATYKMASTNDPDTIREATDERAGQYALTKEWLNGVVNFLPDYREDVDGMLKRLELVNNIADSIYNMTKTGDREQARFILEFKFDPTIVDAATSMNRLIDILGGQTKTTMEATAYSKTETYRTLSVGLVGGTLLTIVIAMFLAHWVVARPLQRLSDVMRQLAQGQFEIQIEGLKRTDEVGTMAKAVLVFRDNGVALREAQQLRTQARELAAAEKREALEKIARSFEGTILNVAGTLASSATQLDGSAHSMSKAADESGRHADDATAVARETTEVAGTVSSAIDELSMAMSDIDLQLANASSVVDEATRRADVVVSHVAGLNSAVSEIDKVASLVSAIASQTNLLALNATIEAARAGEAGRGFAVVAQEVKALATQTTRALADIKAKTSSIGAIIDGVHNATLSMWSAITQIETVSRSIANSVSIQSQATHKIAETVEGAASRTRKVSSAIAGVSEFASRTQLGAQHVQQAAAELNSQATALQSEAKKFVTQVRAA
jgi:methyl-accepting chemotaxis protein